jgi:CCR4-NOT transcriptional regulation complex NOT5 subunit
MRNLFQEGTYQAGLGVSVPVGGGFRPLRMGQAAATVELKPLKFPDLDKKPDARPMDAGRLGRLSPRTDRFQWAVDRLCGVMRKLGATKANPQAVSRVFWAFVNHAKSSEESVLAAYQGMCPDLPVPGKPIKRIGEKPSVQVPVTYKEAVQISTELDKAMETVTEEAVVQRADAEASGALAPEDLPQVEIAQEELAAFVAAGNTGATLSIDQELVSVADKAIQQASDIKTENTTKGLLTAAGVVGVGALLVYLV